MFNGVFVDSVQISGAIGGSHVWQVVAIDVAGNRTLSESRQLRYDLPPLPFDVVSPADGSWTNSSTPTFTWKPTTDAGSGLAKYQVWIDGVLAVDNIPVTATTATATSVVADGAHVWQVYAVDNAGALRRSREDWTLRVDTAPPASFSVVCPGLVTSPTPQICWNTPSDLGSGLDHYSLTIDGVLNRAKIAAATTGTNCTTPAAALAEGQHAWSVTAYDAAGNATVSGAYCGPLVVDFSPPAAFALVSPVGDENCTTCGGNVVVVDTLTPTFVWQASSSSGSGLDHYEIYIDGASTCSVCNIPATATSVVLANPLSPGQHYWQIYAFDRLGGSVQGYIPNSQDLRAWFTTSCTGTCLSAAEPRPEPAPEPARDGGIDAPVDAATDGPTATATSTSTATGTSVIAEPRPDGAPVAGDDAPILMADAATSDATSARDGLTADGLLASSDAWTATLGTDASTGSNLLDGGLGLADALMANTTDAKVAAPDGSRSGSMDSSRYDAGAGGKSGASGCSCVVGGHDARPAWGFPMMVLGLLAFWRGSRPRRRGPRTWQS
jgi:MYXO-CTERM domain-containing protein